MVTTSPVQSESYVLPTPARASPRRAALHVLLMVLPLLSLLSLTVAAPFSGVSARAPQAGAPLRADEGPAGQGTAC